jgi:hypothetical protein
MTEEDTFRKLKRPSLEKMRELYREWTIKGDNENLLTESEFLNGYGWNRIDFWQAVWIDDHKEIFK